MLSDFCCKFEPFKKRLNFYWKDSIDKGIDYYNHKDYYCLEQIIDQYFIAKTSDKKGLIELSLLFYSIGNLMKILMLK